MCIIDVDRSKKRWLTDKQAARLKAAVDAGQVRDGSKHKISWERDTDYRGDLCLDQVGYENCVKVAVEDPLQ